MQFDVGPGFKAHARTNLVTTVAAGTGTAGHLLAMRNPAAAGGPTLRLRALEVSCTVLTAFTAAQEVGFDVFKATSFTQDYTGGLGVLPSKANKNMAASQVTATQLRVGDTGAITAPGSPPTLDANPLASDSFWAAGLGSFLAFRRYDFRDYPLGGLLFFATEGLVLRNAFLMGAAGVLRWAFGLSFDEVAAG